MALRDTWHRALVYFGLAEDHGVRRRRSRAGDRAEGELSSRARPADRYVRRWTAAGAARDRRHLRRRRAAGAIPAHRRARPVGARGAADVQVHLVTPRNFNDAQEVADRFKQAVPVILNLQAADTELSSA